MSRSLKGKSEQKAFAAEKTHRELKVGGISESSREKRLKNVLFDVNEAAISQTLNNYVINSSFTLFNPFRRFTEKKSCLRDSTVKRCRRFMDSSPSSFCFVCIFVSLLLHKCILILESRFQTDEKYFSWEFSSPPSS